MRFMPFLFFIEYNINAAGLQYNLRCDRLHNKRLSNSRVENNEDEKNGDFSIDLLRADEHFRIGGR